MSNALYELEKEEAELANLEEKTSKAAQLIFENDFGKKAAARVEKLARKFNPEYIVPVPRKRRVIIRTEEDPNRVLAWAVGQRIRMAREQQGLRQEDLAEKAGIQRPNIARIEKGKHLPSISTLQKVARALGLDMSALMTAPATSEEGRHELTEMAEWGSREWGEALKEEDHKK